MPWFIELLICLTGLAMFGFAMWMGWTLRGLHEDVKRLEKKIDRKPWEQDPDPWEQDPDFWKDV